MATAYIDNDHCINLLSVEDQDGVAVEGATVTVVLMDKSYSAIAGPLWPMTLNDKGGGLYSHPLPNTFQMQLETKYKLEVTVKKNGIQSRWYEPLVIDRRTF